MEPQTPPAGTPDQPPDPVTSQEIPHIEPVVSSRPPRQNKNHFILLAGLVLLLGAAAAFAVLKFGTTSKPSVAPAQNIAAQKTAQTTSSNAEGLQLDPSKNYGNKYSNGILPVGDGKYVTDTAKAGYVYACAGYAANLKTGGGGAGRRGPWFVGTTDYDLNKKAHVQGSKLWQAEFSNTVAGATRTITTNDLPSHPTGVFPISASDPAYAYDRNPNSIKGQTFSYALSAAPSYGNPNCVGGQVGVMLTGVALFSGFDAAGRDAGAWEVQDGCDGHPEKSGTYHYHTLSSCIKDTSVKTVIGFALDGFPITGPKVGENNMLTSGDLDACHGLTSQVVLDGKLTTTYHYVMTQDFPYSVSCFRSPAIQPPGQPQAIPQ
jgi:hypothetical protein